MTHELDGRKCLGGVGDFEIARLRASRDGGDRCVDGVEIDDEQRRAVRVREPIGRDPAENEIAVAVSRLAGR